VQVITCTALIRTPPHLLRSQREDRLCVIKVFGPEKLEPEIHGPQLQSKGTSICVHKI